MRSKENHQNSQMTTATCPNCGGIITFDPDRDMMAKCPYCDQSFKVSDLMHETEKEHLERMRAKQESEKINFQREQMNFAREQIEKQEKKERAEAFKKSKWRKFFTFCAVVAFLILIGEFAGGSVGGIALSLLICFLYVLYFLMGFQSIREPFNGFHNLLAILALMLVFAYGVVTPSGTKTYSTEADVTDEADEAEVIDWEEDVILHDHLPEPSSLKAVIDVNQDDWFRADFYDQTKDDYEAYVEACKNMGYLYSQDGFTNWYGATNADYYDLTVSYDEDSNTLGITLYAPGEITDITWPTAGVGALLPVPEVTPLQGILSQESSDTYSVMLLHITATDFGNYISACQEAGFTEDFYKTNDRYEASDVNGNDLDLTYEEGIETLSIYVNAD